MDQSEQGEKIAAILVGARNDGEDVGELIAAALNTAMKEKEETPFYFVDARKGSWEAAIVMEWAEQGGNATPAYVKQLAPLLIEIGEAKENGGEIMSLAVSIAVDAMEGFEPLLGFSPHYWDLANLGKQFSKKWPDDPYERFNNAQ